MQRSYRDGLCSASYEHTSVAYSSNAAAHTAVRELDLLLLYFVPRYSIPRELKKIMPCNTKKYKNQAGMNLTPPPPPSQNSHAVRWHCTAESQRRVAEIKS